MSIQKELADPRIDQNDSAMAAKRNFILDGGNELFAERLEKIQQQEEMHRRARRKRIYIKTMEKLSRQYFGITDTMIRSMTAAEFDVWKKRVHKKARKNIFFTAIWLLVSILIIMLGAVIDNIVPLIIGVVSTIFALAICIAICAESGYLALLPKSRKFIDEIQPNNF